MAHRDSTTVIDYRVAPGIPSGKIQSLILPLSVRHVEKAIKYAHGVGFEYLSKKSRKKEAIMMRYQAIYLLYIYTPLTFQSICDIFKPAINNHGSAISAFNNISKAIDDLHLVKHPYLLTRFDKCLEFMSTLEPAKIKIDSRWEIQI